MCNIQLHILIYTYNCSYECAIFSLAISQFLLKRPSQPKNTNESFQVPLVILFLFPCARKKLYHTFMTIQLMLLVILSLVICLLHFKYIFFSGAGKLSSFDVVVALDCVSCRTEFLYVFQYFSQFSIHNILIMNALCQLGDQIFQICVTKRLPFEEIEYE